MGGKSRKSGGVSKALINRIKQGRGGSKKRSKDGGKPDKKRPEGLFDNPSKE